jgi:hypothetical protein
MNRVNSNHYSVCSCVVCVGAGQFYLLWYREENFCKFAPRLAVEPSSHGSYFRRYSSLKLDQTYKIFPSEPR